ncbi:calcium-translocating P-type ATPase [Linderina pennispora]|uniref:Calcium-transporting ATPase 2 n=1 Tax=Linderina pennispora TaxID=61395 RepID=A0A1Y1VVD2_9FUNG|nr:calcium-translocating P-type ATPase [Linderina pennispora]ORX65261.1 calcium-translocating P-type ATPase [Linderina pennispora]
MKLYYERVAKFGVNILPPVKSRSFLGLVWDALHDKMLILLVVAAIVSLGIGIYQDVRPNPDPEDSEDVHWKEKQFRRLNAKKNDRRVRVTRGAQERLVSTNCIMVGDILHIEPGDILCADGVVVSASNLKCDESSVTGESDALRKRCLEEADQANADRRKERQSRRRSCAPSAASSGHGRQRRACPEKPKPKASSKNADPFLISGSRVLESFYGRTLMSLRKENEPTPLQAKLNDLAELIAKLGGGRSADFGRHEVSHEATKVVDNVVRIVITAVTIIVVAVPEGLPLAVTLSLAVATTACSRTTACTSSARTRRHLGHAAPSRQTAALRRAGHRHDWPCGCSDKAVLPTLLETETRRQRRLRDRRQRHQRRRLGRMGSSGFSSSSAMTPLSDASPSVSGISDLSDFSDDEDLIIPTAELAEEAPHAIMSLCHDAIAVCSTAFIPADDSSSAPASHGALASNEESSEANAQVSSADKFTGSKTETAMLSWSEILGAPSYTQLREDDVERSVQIRRREDGKSIWRLYVKGAPEMRQDREEIMNQQASSNPSMSNYSGDDEDAPAFASVAMPSIPQINLENDSDEDNLEPNMPALATGDSSYLLSAHYTGSQNIGSDTTDVNDDAYALNFPPDFAHNPAIPALPLDDETLRDLRRTVAHYASRALRTIGVATATLRALTRPGCELRDSAGLVCLGIFAIEDPLRDGVTDAVRRCQNAGIIVRMVTGDNVLTARAIATQCGIYTPGMGGIVLEGPKFRRLSPEQMDVIVPRLQVLARSSPEDKRMLVEWLRTHGEVVSVTGDGTNDGPALKAANVGFSMGIAGTEVAKEASSIVVMDDNFKSIVRACMWGRAVNDSVKKFLQFQITVNVTAVLIAFVSSIVDKEQKSVFTAVQLLWINLIMDTFAALALATDPPSEELLDRYPEKQGSPLITFTMWKNIIGQSIFQVVVCFLTLYAADDIFHLHTVESSYDMLVLRTLVFNTFAWMQIFNEFNCRVLHNEVIIIQWGGAAFQTTALSAKYWAFSIVGGFVALPVGLVLRLVPDQLIWWMMPFIPQDIYKTPPILSGSRQRKLSRAS